MAANLIHGAPGSFKSASITWYEVLPALRAGRLVVTNIEGILTKESIEIELNEVFPESADIWRLSSQSDTGRFLWQRWFWWMPIGALIVLDEVQDVFPNDVKYCKPDDFDYQGIELLKDKLPESFYSHHFDVKKKFQPEIDESRIDDTGEAIVDSDGFVLYPKNMREANMRHRKYNWDIIYATPDISEVHKLVRSVVQYAYKYKYFDSLEFIPYFFRRPRYHEHSAKTNGDSLTKGVKPLWRKIPLDVHKCYRSTSTDAITKRRGVNSLKDPVLIGCIFFLLLSVGYLVNFFLLSDSSSVPVQEPKKVSSKVNTANFETNQSNFLSSSIDDRDSIYSDDFGVLTLPYEADSIFMSGYTEVILNKQKRFKDYLFVVYKGDDEYYLDTSDMRFFDFEVRFVNPCKVEIKQGDYSRFVYCPPTRKSLLVPEQLVSNTSLTDDIKIF